MTKTTWATAIHGGLTVPSPGTSGRYLIAANRVLNRGDEIEISEAFVEATRDREGYSIFADGVPSDDAQLRAWGRIRLVPGRVADNPDLAAALEAEAAERAEADRQARLIEARRYGRRYAEAGL